MCFILPIVYVGFFVGFFWFIVYVGTCLYTGTTALLIGHS